MIGNQVERALTVLNPVVDIASPSSHLSLHELLVETLQEELDGLRHARLVSKNVRVGVQTCDRSLEFRMV